MTNITINIKLPSLSLPRQQAKILILGVLIGAVFAYDLSSGSSKILGVWTKISGPSKSEIGAPLTEAQRQRFKNELAQFQAPSKKMAYLKVIYAANCLSCAKDANDVAKIINVTKGWQVSSLSSQVNKQSYRGIVFQVNENDVDSREGIKVISSAFRAAGISFHTEEGEAKAGGEFVLFFGPGKD